MIGSGLRPTPRAPSAAPPAISAKSAAAAIQSNTALPVGESERRGATARTTGASTWTPSDARAPTIAARLLAISEGRVPARRGAASDTTFEP
jgi:hypothetical protein